MNYDEIADRVLHEETKSIMNALPDIASILLNEEVSWDEETKDNDHLESVFSEIKLNEVPDNLLDSELALKLFIEWDLLKSCSTIDQRIIDKTLDFLHAPEVIKLYESIFWIVNVLKFQNDNVRLVKKLRRRISGSYTATLSLCPSPKEEVLALLQFCIGYMVHMMHHKIFPKQRSNFSVRFLLDCYHIVVYELTGLLVSDVYIYNQIERIYGDRFFLYKQEGILDLTNVDLYEGSTYFDKTAVTQADIDRLRLSTEFGDVIRREISEFGSELTDKFSKVAKMLHANSKSNLLLAKMEGELAKKVRQVMQMENFQEVIIARARKINESQMKSKEEEMTNYGSQKNLESTDLVHSSKEDISKSKKHLKKSSTTSSLPMLKIKQKFDCAQVSPPLQMVAKNVTASTKKKTIAFTSFNVPDFDRERLDKLYDSYLVQVKDKQKLKEKKEKERREDGPFVDRNVAKYGQGSENLLNSGISPELTKKFTEFYVIKNVCICHC